MPNKRDLKLDNYGITKEAYRELEYFCLQYEKKKRSLSECYSLRSPVCSDMPRSGGTGNPTAKQALNAIKLQKDLCLIEQTAIEASRELYPYLLKNVTDRSMTYEKMAVPCGRRQFYEYRRLFFYLLWAKMGNTEDVFS